MHFGLRERHALAGAVIRDDLLHLRDHLALAGRSAHMRANIEIGEELAAELEHGNLKPLEAEDLAARVRKFRHRSDVHLAHDRGSPLSLRSIEPQRFRPPARINALTVTTISLGVTRSGVTGRTLAFSVSVLAA